MAEEDNPYDQLFTSPPAGEELPPPTAKITVPAIPREVPAAMPMGEVNPYEQLITAPPQYEAPVRRPAELRSYDQSPSDTFRSKLQDVFIGWGARPYVARDLADKATNLGAATPLGSVLSAGADLPYHFGHGQYVPAALDALGVTPALSTAKRLWRGLPTRIPAHEPPPWAQRVDQPASVYGTAPEARGWVTPTPGELAGERGGVLGPAIRGTGPAGYDAMRASPILYHPEIGNDLLSTARAYIEQPRFAFSRQGAPGTYDLLDETAREWAARGWPSSRPITTSDFDVLRSKLKNLPGPDGVAGHHAADVLDAYMLSPPAHRVVRGTAADFNELRTTMDQARGDYRAGKTAGTVDTAIDRAGTRRGSTFSGRSVNNTRQNLAAFSTSNPGEDRIFGALPRERAAIYEASQGTTWQNKQRELANLMGGGGGLGGAATLFGGMSTGAGIGAGVGAAVGMPAVGGAVGAVGGAVPFIAGRALNTASNEASMLAGRNVVRDIARNSPEYERRLANAGPPVTDVSGLRRDIITTALADQLRRKAIAGWQSQYMENQE